MTTVLPTSQIVICANTFRAAWERRTTTLSIVHVGNVAEKIKRVGEIVNAEGRMLTLTKEIGEAALRFGMEPSTDPLRGLYTYWDHAFGLDVERGLVALADGKIPSADKTMVTRLTNFRDRLATIYSDGPGQKGESLWDAFGAVTYFVDHEGGRTKIESPVRRWERAQLGHGAEVKSNALRRAAELVGFSVGAK
jgi:hypothetical protein